MLGPKFPEAASQTKHENNVASIPTPFQIISIQQRGKEISIGTNKGYLMVRSMGTGAYLYGLENKKDLNKEPFLSDGFLSFCGDADECLVFVDCRSSRHQIKFEFVKTKIWSINRSPCMLTETGLFQQNFISVLRNPCKREYFRSHSIAYVMFDQLYCNGFGQYTTSEVLFHFLLDFGLRPWEIAWTAFTKHDGLLESLLCAATMFMIEVSYYCKNFNPAIFDKEQQKQRNSYRLDFLKVYGKKTFRGQEVVCFSFDGPNGRKSIYTLAIAVADLPPVEEYREVESVNPGALLQTADIIKKNENWYRVRPMVFTPDQLGVGPNDWHRTGEIPELIENGLPENLPAAVPPVPKPKPLPPPKKIPPPIEEQPKTFEELVEGWRKQICFTFSKVRNGKKATALRLMRTFLFGNAYRIHSYLNDVWKDWTVLGFKRKTSPTRPEQSLKKKAKYRWKQRTILDYYQKYYYERPILDYLPKPTPDCYPAYFENLNS